MNLYIFIDKIDVIRSIPSTITLAIFGILIWICTLSYIQQNCSTVLDLFWYQDRALPIVEQGARQVVNSVMANISTDIRLYIMDGMPQLWHSGIFVCLYNYSCKLTHSPLIFFSPSTNGNYSSVFSFENVRFSNISYLTRFLYI